MRTVGDDWNEVQLGLAKEEADRQMGYTPRAERPNACDMCHREIFSSSMYCSVCKLEIERMAKFKADLIMMTNVEDNDDSYDPLTDCPPIALF